MLKKVTNKILLVLLLTAVSIGSFANCFGKFALVRKVYEFNTSLQIGGNPLIGKALRTLLFYVFVVLPVYTIAGLVDFIVLNLIEFWTDSNPMGMNEFDKEGKLVKTTTSGSESVVLTYSEFGKKLHVDMKNGKEEQSLILFKNEPGKFFTEKNGKLEEVQMSSKTFGDKMLIKKALNGKLESSKLVDTKTFTELEEKISTQL